MFQPNETANDLFRRMNSNNNIQNTFNIQLKSDKIEKLSFGEIIEVQGFQSELPQFILGSAIDFATQYEQDGYIFHISLGNDLYNAILHSQIDITSTSLYRMHKNDHVKSIIVHSLIQLLAAIELLKITLQNEKALVLLDGLSHLFLVERINNDIISDDTLMISVMKSLQLLVQTHYAIAIWTNIAILSKHAIGLRDGLFSRDSLSTSWKQFVLTNYQFQEY